MRDLHGRKRRAARRAEPQQRAIRRLPPCRLPEKERRIPHALRPLARKVPALGGRAERPSATRRRGIAARFVVVVEGLARPPATARVENPRPRGVERGVRCAPRTPPPSKGRGCAPVAPTTSRRRLGRPTSLDTRASARRVRAAPQSCRRRELCSAAAAPAVGARQLRRARRALAAGRLHRVASGLAVRCPPLASPRLACRGVALTQDERAGLLPQRRCSASPTRAAPATAAVGKIRASSGLALDFPSVAAARRVVWVAATLRRRRAVAFADGAPRWQGARDRQCCPAGDANRAPSRRRRCTRRPADAVGPRRRCWPQRPPVARQPWGDRSIEQREGCADDVRDLWRGGSVAESRRSWDGAGRSADGDQPRGGAGCDVEERARNAAGEVDVADRRRVAGPPENSHRRFGTEREQRRSCSSAHNGSIIPLLTSASEPSTRCADVRQHRRAA